MTFPTTEQFNFVNSWCTKLLIRAGSTNILGLGRDDILFTRVITSLTRRQAIGVDQYYRTMNNQNLSLPAKLESLGKLWSFFKCVVSISRIIFWSDQSMSFCCYLTPSPLSSPLSHSHTASEIFNSLESFPTDTTDTTAINEIFCLLPHQELALTHHHHHHHHHHYNQTATAVGGLTTSLELIIVVIK